MTKLPSSFLSSTLRPHLSFLVFFVGSIALFWPTLRELTALSLSADAYTYIVAIPVICAFQLYLERRRIFVEIWTTRTRLAWVVLAGAFGIYGLAALRMADPPAEYVLAMMVLFLLLAWTAAFALCYGPTVLKASRFPLLLLLLMVPIPLNLMEHIVAVLQQGSVEAVYTLFHLAGVPIFRNGVTLELPVVSIEVAKECSSIHSASALFITGLLVGHLFLRFLLSKICLTVLTVPIAMFTNAVRIVTLWFLGTKVDIRFLDGNLHRNGGALFALIGLAILMLWLLLFRKLEDLGRRHAVPVRAPTEAI